MTSVSPARRAVQVGGLAARRAGLTRPAYRALEAWRAWRASDGDYTPPDGLPMPPAKLRIRVIHESDPASFYEGGRLGADVIRTHVEHHRPLGDFVGMLDFGCGCGRIARHWRNLHGPTVSGCDCHAPAVEWCQQNLRFMHAAVNELAPPLPYRGDCFDLVYAISVFTHLSEPMQHAWMAEMRRVLSPGGLLVFSTKGDEHATELTKPGRPGLEAYSAGRLVVVDIEMEGSNLCAAYHPHEWVVNELLEGFELLEFAPGGAKMSGNQDLYVART